MSKAYVLISCETSSERSVISNLKLIETINEVFGTFGSYDVLAKIESDTEEKLRQVITKKVRMVPKIRATLTLMAHENGLFGKKLSSDEKETLDRVASQAYVAIHCKKIQEIEVLRDLNDIPEVIEGDIVSGPYDIMCKVVAPTYNDISDVVTKKIRKIKDIMTTITLNVIP